MSVGPVGWLFLHLPSPTHLPGTGESPSGSRPPARPPRLPR